MKGLVHRRIAAGGIARQAILLETNGGIIVRSLEHDVNAPAQVARHRAAVAFKRRNHLDHAVALQNAGQFFWPQHGCERVGAARREQKTVLRHGKIAGIGDCGHLDG